MSFREENHAQRYSNTCMSFSDNSEGTIQKGAIDGSRQWFLDFLSRAEQRVQEALNDKPFPDSETAQDSKGFEVPFVATKESPPSLVEPKPVPLKPSVTLNQSLLLIIFALILCLICISMRCSLLSTEVELWKAKTASAMEKYNLLTALTERFQDLEDHKGYRNVDANEFTGSNTSKGKSNNLRDLHDFLDLWPRRKQLIENLLKWEEQMSQMRVLLEQPLT